MNEHSTNIRARRLALTLMELLVVVLILSILSTIATGVYTDQTRRARVAATQDLIHQLSIAITRYENDLGAFPPSGTSPVYPATSTGTRNDGSGLLQLALVHGMSGNATSSGSTLWQGPYISLQAGNIGLTTTSTGAMGAYDILDPWGGAIRYVRGDDYATSTTTFAGGTEMFESTAPPGANANLPAPNPYYATEIYYNRSTYQLYSCGPNGLTITSGGTANGAYRGTEADDINNFGY